MINATDRKEFATAAVERLKAALAQMAEAEKLNAADAERLGRLGEELRTLDTQLDPENLQTLQLLAAKRDQHDRLTKKFAADAESRLKAANNARWTALPLEDARACVQQEATALLAEIADALTPYFKTREAAMQLAHQTDSAARMRMVAFMVADWRLPADKVLAILESIAAGEHPRV
jgi:hypothetical protein